MMKPGHIFTIEPMINAGTYHDDLWYVNLLDSIHRFELFLLLLCYSIPFLILPRPDDWTAVTKDGKKSAQFEHTILITETGYELLTKRPFGSYIDRF